MLHPDEKIELMREIDGKKLKDLLPMLNEESEKIGTYTAFKSIENVQRHQERRELITTTILHLIDKFNEEFQRLAKKTNGRTQK